MSESEAERAIASEIRWLKLPVPSREFRFHPTRMFRFDFAWPERKVALEVEGGVYIAGAHTRGRHFESDCVKYNEAALLGWKVLRVTPNQITSGEAVAWLERALKPRLKPPLNPPSPTPPSSTTSSRVRPTGSIGRGNASSRGK